MFTLYDRNYTFFCVSNITLFFKCFGPLLFGRPPDSEAAAAFAKFSQASSFSHLRKVFGSYIPNKPLSQKAFRINAQRRIFSVGTGSQK